jgi:hypothetical protein
MRLPLVPTVAVLLGVMPGDKKNSDVRTYCHTYVHAMYEQCMQTPSNDARSSYHHFMQDY